MVGSATVMPLGLHGTPHPPAGHLVVGEVFIGLAKGALNDRRFRQGCEARADNWRRSFSTARNIGATRSRPACTSASTFAAASPGATPGALHIVLNARDRSARRASRRPCNSSVVVPARRARRLRHFEPACPSAPPSSCRALPRWGAVGAGRRGFGGGRIQRPALHRQGEEDWRSMPVGAGPPGVRRKPEAAPPTMPPPSAPRGFRAAGHVVWRIQEPSRLARTPSANNPHLPGQAPSTPRPACRRMELRRRGSRRTARQRWSAACLGGVAGHADSALAGTSRALRNSDGRRRLGTTSTRRADQVGDVVRNTRRVVDRVRSRLAGVQHPRHATKHIHHAILRT